MDRQDVANPQGGECGEAEIEKLGNWWLPKLGCRLEVKGRWVEKVNENEEFAPQDSENDINRHGTADAENGDATPAEDALNDEKRENAKKSIEADAAMT
jgi:hypothetical protein